MYILLILTLPNVEFPPMKHLYSVLDLNHFWRKQIWLIVFVLFTWFIPYPKCCKAHLFKRQESWASPFSICLLLLSFLFFRKIWLIISHSQESPNYFPFIWFGISYDYEVSWCLFLCFDVISKGRTTNVWTEHLNYYVRFPKGRLPKKNTSYLVTLSLKVGGGQDEITLLGAAKIVTRL